MHNHPFSLTTWQEALAITPREGEKLYDMFDLITHVLVESKWSFDGVGLSHFTVPKQKESRCPEVWKQLIHTGKDTCKHLFKELYSRPGQ